MNYPKIPLAQQVIQLCVAKNVQHVVISPGSRNAPLTIGFSSHPSIKAYSIVDERCAAFFALGMAQQLQKPVAVVCTSGSALLNYYPAVAEAFYSEIPLIVISADRPKHLINIGDGQTIQQENVFGKHIVYSANLQQDLQENNERYSDEKDIPAFVLDKLLNVVEKRLDSNQQKINEAINHAITQRGPVHINVPFAEPLYETTVEFSEKINVIAPAKITDEIEQAAFENFVSAWKSAKRRMVVVGVHTPNAIEQRYLDFLGQDEATLVFTESTSNIHHPNFLSSIDKIIAPLDAEGFSSLQPEVLLTLGGLVVSKKIKAFLRTHSPKAHFHVGLNKALDTYFCLKHHFRVSENMFFRALLNEKTQVDCDYQLQWLKVKKHRAKAHEAYLKTIPFTDFKVFQIVLKSIPEMSVLHLSNSSTIRYVQLFNQKRSINQYCNRGTSGIDGSTSTAIGHAVHSKKQNILITGDLSFFYDSNALWNNYITSNFKVIVVNNSGGGIFRILPGQKHTENFQTYFETTHHLTAVHLCNMYGFKYYRANNEKELTEGLNAFFTLDDKPGVLEVFTPREMNDEVLLQYFVYLAENS